MTKVTAEKRKRHIFKARIVGILFVLFMALIYFVDQDMWSEHNDKMWDNGWARALYYVFPALSSPLPRFLVTIIPIILFVIFLDKITKYYENISK